MKSRRLLKATLLAMALFATGTASAAISFLPAIDAPILLLFDAAALTPARAAQAAKLGYHFDPQMLSDCSATDLELLASRLRTAPYVIAVLDAADHALVLQALRFEGFRIDHQAAVAAVASTAEPELLAPVLALLRDATPAAGLHAILARRP